MGIKARRIQLSISEPCSEKWAEMTPATGGRHCMSCNKVVTDFTGMTDRELFAFFQENSYGCGRFYEEQLDRPITEPQQPGKTLWMRIALGIMVLLGIAKEGGAQQKARKPQAATNTPTPQNEQDTLNKPDAGIRRTEIYGVVKDPKGEEIPNAGVRLLDSHGNLLNFSGTDLDGRYSIIIAHPTGDMICSMVFTSQVQTDTLTDVPVKIGEALNVNFSFSNPILTYDGQVNFKFGMISNPGLLQPAGIHTTHKMQPWE